MGYDSALNEDAGKQILSSFDEYVTKGRLMTKIHAEPHTRKKKKALQHDNDRSNRKSKGGDKDNMHSETKENDSSKSNEFANECNGHSHSGKNKENQEND